MAGSVRRHVGLVGRLVAAGVGLGLIALLLAGNWHGRVVLPAGYGPVAHGELSVAVRRVERVDGAVVYVLAPNAAGVERVAAAVTSDAADTPTRVPGAVETIGGASPGYLLGSLVLVGLVFPIQAARWRVLLVSRRLLVPYRDVLSLTMVGMFFNMCLPGSTGGDVVRAWYAARGTDRRTDAVVSIGIDRMAGLLGLFVLAAGVGLTRMDDPVVRRIVQVVGLVFAGMVVGAVVYGSGPVRRVIHGRDGGTEGRGDEAGGGRPGWRVPGLGLLRKIDAAVVAYRHHKLAVLVAVGLSVGVHLSLATAAALAGQAMGIEAPLLATVSVMPVVFFAGSVPVSPSGLGVMEGVAVLLVPGSVVQVISLMLAFRLCQLVYAGIGGVLMLVKDVRLSAVPGAGVAGAGSGVTGGT